MLKLLASLFICSVFCFASFNDFIAKAYEKNEKIRVISVKTDKILSLKNGFEAHFLTITLSVKGLKNSIQKSDIVFVKDEIFTTDMIDIKTKMSFRDELLGEKISVNFKKEILNENVKNCN